MPLPAHDVDPGRNDLATVDPVVASALTPSSRLQAAGTQTVSESPSAVRAASRTAFTAAPSKSGRSAATVRRGAPPAPTVPIAYCRSATGSVPRRRLSTATGIVRPRSEALPRTRRVRRDDCMGRLDPGSTSARRARGRPSAARDLGGGFSVSPPRRCRGRRTSEARPRDHPLRAARRPARESWSRRARRPETPPSRRRTTGRRAPPSPAQQEAPRDPVGPEAT